jgi:hypothetical protein
LNQAKVSSNWAAVIVAINTEMDSASGDIVQVRSVCSQIVIGLRKSSPNALPNLDIQKIMMIIEFIMKLLEMFMDGTLTPESFQELMQALDTAQKTGQPFKMPSVLLTPRSEAPEVPKVSP